jgi:hypothetical protein
MHSGGHFDNTPHHHFTEKEKNKKEIFIACIAPAGPANGQPIPITGQHQPALEKHE